MTRIRVSDGPAVRRRGRAGRGAAYLLGLRTPSAIAAAAPPAAASHHAAGFVPQLMFTSVKLSLVVESSYGPSVQTTLLSLMLNNSTWYFFVSPRLPTEKFALLSSGEVPTTCRLLTSRTS